MMKKLLALRWWLCVALGIFVGAWLAADLDPVLCQKETKLCSNQKCRRYPGDPLMEECTYKDCKYGYAWRATTPSYYSCCTSVITPDPRIPWSCCNIPYFRVKCKTQDGQPCGEEFLPQDCDLYVGNGMCPEEVPPPQGGNRGCIGL